MAEMDTFEQPSTPSVDAASVMAGPQPVANSSNEGTAAPAQPSPVQPASEQQAPQPVKAPQPNAAAAAASNGTAVPGAAVTARPAVADHPAVQRAGLLHSIAESLAGGPRYKTSIDVNTGATTRTAVPLSGREIGMAIALEAISGSLAGLQGGRGRGAGGAGMAGLNQGQKIAQMRQQKQQEEDQRASGDYARQAAIATTNMGMARNQQFLANADREMQQADVDGYQSIYKMAKDAGAVDREVGEAELQKLLSDGNAHVTRDMAIPIQVLDSLNADGTVTRGLHGEQKHEKKYALLKPWAQITMPKDVMDTLVENKVQGYVDSEGKPIDLPQDYGHRLQLIVDGKVKADKYRNTKAMALGVAKGRENPLHSGTAPKADTTPKSDAAPASGPGTSNAPTKIPDIANAHIAMRLDAEAKKQGVDPALVRAVAKQESGGNHIDQDGKIVTSKTGALGVMQLEPTTAQGLGVDPNNLDQNIAGGVRYLKQMLDKYKGNVEKAVAAYNAGPEAVDKADGVPNFPETKNYVNRVFGFAGLTPGGGQTEGGNTGTPQGAAAPQGATKGFTPTVSDEQAEELYKKIIRPETDADTMLRAGGWEAWYDGKPGTPSSVMHLVQTGKLDGASVGRWTQYFNAVRPIEADRQQRVAEAAHVASQEAATKAGMEVTARKKAEADAEQPVIDTAAQGLVSPNNLTSIRDIAGYRSDMKLRIYAKARELDPNFNPGLTEQRVHFLHNYENPSGRASVNRNAINNILQHAGDLSDVNQEYRRADVRIVNTPLNAIARQFGDTTFKKYAVTSTVLKDELSLYFAGGYAPTKDQQSMWDRIQKDEATPGETEAFAKEVVHLGLRRATTFNSQYKKMMGYNDPNMIIPEAKLAAERLGLANEVSVFGSGGQYGQAAQQQPSALPGSGKTWSAKTWLTKHPNDDIAARTAAAKQQGYTVTE